MTCNSITLVLTQSFPQVPMHLCNTCMNGGALVSCTKNVKSRLNQRLHRGAVLLVLSDPGTIQETLLSSKPARRRRARSCGCCPSAAICHEYSSILKSYMVMLLKQHVLLRCHGLLALGQAPGSNLSPRCRPQLYTTA